jgi:hypothetical protein
LTELPEQKVLAVSGSTGKNHGHSWPAQRKVWRPITTPLTF